MSAAAEARSALRALLRAVDRSTTSATGNRTWREAVLAEARRAAAAAAAECYGEPWHARKARVQLVSPHGRRPGWDLRCVIVKTGDDCRQELLAMQLIRAFHEIFAEAQLPLWLRPYEVRRLCGGGGCWRLVAGWDAA